MHSPVLKNSAKRAIAGCQPAVPAGFAGTGRDRRRGTTGTDWDLPSHPYRAEESPTWGCLWMLCSYSKKPWINIELVQTMFWWLVALKDVRALLSPLCPHFWGRADFSCRLPYPQHCAVRPGGQARSWHGDRHLFYIKKKEQSVMERGGETKRLSGERARSQIPCPQPACPLCSRCCRPDGSLGAPGQMAGLDGGCTISAGRSGKRSSILCRVIYCSPPGCQALQQHAGEKFTQGNEWVGAITRLPSLGTAEKNRSSVWLGPCEPPGSRQ